MPGRLQCFAMSEMKTFVFTDIVRSVDLKGQMAGTNDAERDQAFVSTILMPHRVRIEEGLEKHGGRVVSTAGDGHFLVFSNTINAASWAVAVQQRHRDDPVKTPAGEGVSVRMSLHVGFPQADPNDPSNFIGRVVDYAARLNDYASSGQILISAAALGLLKDAGLDGVDFHLHGQRFLKGIGAVDVHELLYDNSPPRQMRKSPSDIENREWTILPATMGLTEYARSGSSSGTAVSPTAPAKQLGNYELGELLGSGGMGAVYRARHSQFDRDRAVKVIKPHLIPDDASRDGGHAEIIRRFYREIKAMGALEHPNIVVAIDSSSPSDQTHYLVMEYVDGIGADRLLQSVGPLPVGAACEVARQAAVGLEYLHRRGMVHRDIKPSNLMLTMVDRASLPGMLVSSPSSTDTGDDSVQAPLVKILDLGLALLVTEDDARLTQMGHGGMGTAMYMSPEQWNTTSVDIRSDIYSLGCTLFHLLTGRPPFFDSDLRPQRAHEQLPVPTDFGRPDVPKPVKKVLKKMMAKRPDDRYASPSEVAQVLAEIADSKALSTAIEQNRRAQPNATTHRGDRSDTLPHGGSGSDTLSPGALVTPTPRQLSWPSAPPKPPLWRRVLVPFAMVLALGCAGWMAIVASQNVESMRQQQRENLEGFAGLASTLLKTEIDQRFDMLARAAKEPQLLQAIEGIDLEDRSTWEQVQQWIIEHKTDADQRIRSGSWFIVTRQGTQVARAPKSSSIGKSYSMRDYFHGQGYQLPDDVTPEPITSAHQSAVYRSSSTKELKVAFSTPIWSKSESGEPATVVGILAMSVELGTFRVFEDVDQLPESLEVVLLDLRGDDQGPAPTEDDPPRRGLLLHHPRLAQFEDPDNPFRLPQDLLSQIDSATRNREGALQNPIIEGYPDLLGRATKGRYIGAFEPVVITTDDGQVSQWLVIVQEEL